MASCQNFAKQDLKSGQIISIKGKLRLVGNVPFQHLIVSDTQHSYELRFDSKQEKHAFLSLQGKTLKIFGKLQLLTKITPDFRYTNQKFLLQVSKFKIMH